MVSNDIAGLKPGQGCHAALLTVKGKLLADLVIYDLGEFGLLIELVRVARDSVRASLERHLIMDDATVVDLTEGFDELGVYGPGAAAALVSATGLGTAETLSGLPTYGAAFTAPAPAHGGLPTLIAATRDLGSPGFHVMAPVSAMVEIEARLLSAGAHLLTDEAAEVLRIEAGIPLYGRDLDEDRMPAEAGLDDAVSFTKGCYLGQEVVVRLRDRGHLNRKLCGLRLSAGPPAPAGTRLRSPERPNAGTITSSVESPRLGPIALGYVHRSAWEPGTTLELMAVSPSGEETPLGRTAVVCPLPFPAPPPTSDPPTDR
jgi:folate-binding protein YgfZ